MVAVYLKIAYVIMFHCTMDFFTSHLHMTDSWINGMYVSLYLVMYLCMYVCMYALCVCVYLYICVCVKEQIFQRLLDIRVRGLMYIYFLSCSSSRRLKHRLCEYKFNMII